MKLNEIKFTPKSNAFADVYSKATGMPFVGEMMVAAAGNGGEPTPPTPSVVESVTVYGQQLDVTAYGIYGTVTFNQDFVSENCGHYADLTVDIKDSSNTTICELFGNFGDCETNVYYPSFSDGGTLPTLPESGNYSIVVSTNDYEHDPVVIYEGTGTWTYQAPQI